MNRKALLTGAGLLALLFFAGRANAGASAKAARLIRETESYSAKPYLDEGGTWHIGYGRKLNKRPPSDMEITKQQAERFLREDMKVAENAVERLVDQPLNTNQKAALTSFVYNLGQGAFKNSTLLKRLNAGDYQGAAEQLTRWIHVDGRPSTGLATRRQAEKQLFLQ